MNQQVDMIGDGAPFLGAPLLIAGGRVEESPAQSHGDEARTLDLLLDISTLLFQRDLVPSQAIEPLVKLATKLVGAEFGGYFVNTEAHDSGENWVVGGLYGIPKHCFEALGDPSRFFADIMDRFEIVRSDDTTNDPRFGKYGGQPEEHPLVRSYISAPILARNGRLRGALLLGSRKLGAFSPRSERLIRNLAAKVALAFDCADDRDRLQQEIERRKRAEEVSRLSETKVREMMEHLPHVIWLMNADLRVEYINRAGHALFGAPYTQAEMVHPEDWADLNARRHHARETGEGYTTVVRYRHHSGRYRVHRAEVVPIRINGSPYCWIGTAADIHDLTEAQATQNLLLAELNHRVKNTLAIVMGMAKQTLRYTPEPNEFRERFEARILALSATHNVLTNANWEPVSLAAIVRTELVPFHGELALRWFASGPQVMLRPEAAVSMGMLTHELATNAAKYGALSPAGGRVDVSWNQSEDGTVLYFDWQESEGPEVRNPERTGFGTRMIQTLHNRLGGDLVIDYAPKGVHCRVAVSMASVQS